MTDQEQKDFFEECVVERSAIREFCGGQSRLEAEKSAREECQIDIFRCLIRQMIRWKIEGRRDDVVRWLDKADCRRPGRDPAERKRYVDALNEQIRFGNKGNAGEWKTASKVDN